MQLYFLTKFNNYANRRLIKFDDIANYNDELYSPQVISNVAFNPSDGVDTTQIVNWSGLDSPDYCVVVNDLGNIVSRWFVVEFTRLRTGQYRANMHRDLKVDYYDQLMDADCIITKGYVDDNNPLVFNDEGQAYNQIKTSETLLFDKSRCAWIVGYIPRDAFSESTTVTASFQEGIDISVAGIENWEYYANSNVGNHNATRVLYPFEEITYSIKGNPGQKQYLLNLVYGNKKYYKPSYPDFATYNVYNGYATLTQFILHAATKLLNKPSEELARIANNVTLDFDALNAQTNTQLGTSSTNFNNIVALNNKVIKDTTTNKIYRITLNMYDLKEETQASGGLLTMLLSTFPEGLMSTAPQVNNIWVGYKGNAVEINLDIINNGQETISTVMNTSSTRTHLIDSPYDMFCIPYSDDLTIKSSVKPDLITSKDIAMNIANAITVSTGAGNIYDLQILPYCPIMNYLTAEKELTITTMTQSQLQAIYSGEDTNHVGYIFWCNRSSFEIILDDEEYKFKVENAKMQNETDIWRICSPNYNGIFEFNVVKNGGIDYWKISCQYKPYQPFILVSPNFKNLYGTDFKDARGLELGGDFSMPIVTSAFADYQLQNKNYQQIFDRRITTLERKRAMGYLQSQANQLFSISGAAIDGAAEGASNGGGVMGAIMGAGTSTVNAGFKAAQAQTNELFSQYYQMENINAQKAIFNYKLQNIQAIPQSLAKTTAFTPVNKYVPFVEYYTCTELEKQQLKEKLKWNGYTIMVPGRIRDYIKFDSSGKYIDYSAPTNYIEGVLLRITGLPAESHEVQALSLEIQKGFYFEG